MDHDRGPVSDEELVVEFQFAENDEERRGIFDALWARSQRAVFKECFGVLQDVYLSEDAVQETAIVVLQSLHTLNNPDAIRAWIRTIAHRQAIRIGKGAAREQQVSNDELDERRAKDPPFNEDIETADAESKAIDVIKSLHPLLTVTEMELYDLVFVEGLWGAQVAARTGDPNDQKKVTKLKDKLVDLYFAKLLVQEASDSCAALRKVVGTVQERLTRTMMAAVKQHLAWCDSCQAFKKRITIERTPLIFPLIYGSELHEKVQVRVEPIMSDWPYGTHDRKHRPQVGPGLRPEIPPVKDSPRSLPPSFAYPQENQPRGHLHRGQPWAVSSTYVADHPASGTPTADIANPMPPRTPSPSGHAHNAPDLAHQVWHWFF